MSCPECKHRIRGNSYVYGQWKFDVPPRPSFCDDCGNAFPWATRVERIYELENRLDREDIDPADKITIGEQLAKLRESGVSADDEKKIWQVIKEKSGKALFTPAVKNILEGIVSKVIRDSIGI